ncbi:MAG: C40 family peptidase [Burkholderiales bacterium]
MNALRTLLGAASALTAPLIALALAGCASAPQTPEATAVRASDDVALRAVAHAREMLGRPYRFAGDTPAGFDCSGLVRYSYRRAGIVLPRDTQKQRLAATLISPRILRAGDLLFFDQEGKKASHVGMYLGDGRFIHAPSTGGKVRTDPLNADYWKKHFVEARRI